MREIAAAPGELPGFVGIYPWGLPARTVIE
jgi:hypothetical protein